MAKAHHSISYNNWTLVIDEKELRRLCEEMAKALESGGGHSIIKFSFELLLSDKLLITTSELNEVLNEENDKNRRLTSLKITAERGNNLIVLSLGVIKETPATGMAPAGEEKSTELVIDGEDRKWVYVTASTLEERIRRMKQWYPRSGVWATIAAVVGFWLMSKASDFLTHKYGNNDAIGLSMLAAVGVLSFGASRLFPNLVFSIGDGARRHKMLLAIRSNLFWGVLIAVLVGVAAAFFYDVIRPIFLPLLK